MNTTGIEWTTFSANPLKYRDKRTGKVVWACVKKSPGCAHCYAEQLALRYGRGGPFTKAQMEHLEPFLDEAELRKMLTAKTVGGVAVAGSRCFVGDMTDVFAEWVPDALLDRLFAVFALRQDVTWQVLTKRADRMAAYLSRSYARGFVADAAVLSFDRYVWWNTVGHERPGNEVAGPEWPLPNVWCGFSAENQECFDRRAVEMAPLMRAGWTVFVSAEPLLGPVLMQGWDGTVQRNWLGDGIVRWVVVGGESGRGARPLSVEWVRSIVAQCRAASVPVFVKQLGSAPWWAVPGHVMDGDPCACGGCDGKGNEPFELTRGKGGDPAEWPEDIRVREFPTPTGG